MSGPSASRSGCHGLQVQTLKKFKHVLDYRLREATWDNGDNGQGSPLRPLLAMLAR